MCLTDFKSRDCADNGFVLLTILSYSKYIIILPSQKVLVTFPIFHISLVSLTEVSPGCEPV